METDLKPCPFCGKEAVVNTWYRAGNEPMYQVCCENEKCLQPMTDYCIDKGVVEREWNRRADDGK